MQCIVTLVHRFVTIVTCDMGENAYLCKKFVKMGNIALQPADFHGYGTEATHSASMVRSFVRRDETKSSQPHHQSAVVAEGERHHPTLGTNVLRFCYIIPAQHKLLLMR